VVKASLTGVPDVHGGSNPNRLEALQHGDVGSVIGGLLGA